MTTSSSTLAFLQIFVNPLFPELKQQYVEHAKAHNEKILRNLYQPDAGFDLLQPIVQIIPKKISLKNQEQESSIILREIMKKYYCIDFQIQCCMSKRNLHEILNYGHVDVDEERKRQNYGYYLYPRSSCSFTPLRLANSVGIIDAGYRGNIKAMVDFHSVMHLHSDNDHEYDFLLDQYTRLFQLCDPGLMPIYVEIVDSFEDLGELTSRSTGGFGSTNTKEEGEEKIENPSTSSSLFCGELVNSLDPVP